MSGARRGAKAIVAPRPIPLPSAVAGALALLVGLAGCASSDFGATESARALASGAGLVAAEIPTRTHTLFSAARPVGSDVDILHVYLEGDGRAWVSRSRPSLNPTPRNPVALRLAAQDPAAAVAYLGRPCQYVDLAREPLCDRSVWTTDRYAPAEIDAVDDAISALKDRAGAGLIGLNGYSGAGAILAVLADRRDDVAYLRTVAANLDPAAFTAFHDVTPFRRAPDAGAALRRLTATPQIHYVGRRDAVTPPALVRAALGAPSRCVRLVELDAAHPGPWPIGPAALAARPHCAPEPTFAAGQ